MQSCDQQRISRVNWQHLSHACVPSSRASALETISTPEQPHQPACTVNPDSKTASSHTCPGASAGPSDRHTCHVCLCGRDSRQHTNRKTYGCSSCESICHQVAPAFLSTPCAAQVQAPSTPVQYRPTRPPRATAGSSTPRAAEADVARWRTSLPLPLPLTRNSHNINQTLQARQPASNAATDRTTDRMCAMLREDAHVGWVRGTYRCCQDSRGSGHTLPVHSTTEAPRALRNQSTCTHKSTTTWPACHASVGSGCAQSPTTAVLTVADLGQSTHSGSQRMPDQQHLWHTHSCICWYAQHSPCSGHSRGSMVGASSMWRCMQPTNSKLPADFVARPKMQPALASLRKSQRQMDSPSTHKKCHSAESVKKRKREKARGSESKWTASPACSQNRPWPTMLHAPGVAPDTSFNKGRPGSTH